MTKRMTTENSQDWLSQFRDLYERAVDRFEQGQRSPETVVGSEALAFLDSIGTSAQELYDFVEDWVEDGEPDFETVAAMTDVRREYFLTVQEGKALGRGNSVSYPAIRLCRDGWISMAAPHYRQGPSQTPRRTRAGYHVRLRRRPAVFAKREHGTGRILEDRVGRRYG